MRAFAVGMCTVLLGLGLATTASGQGSDEATMFTVTEPVDVGGTILEPGDYQIMVVPLNTNRNMLRIMSPDGSKLFATALSIPHAEGPEGARDPDSRFVYYPASDNSPKALRTWFAGDMPRGGGHDIAYTKERAMELAALANEPVVAVTEMVAVSEYERVPLLLVTPTREVRPFEVDEQLPLQASAAPMQQAENRANAQRLPQTASNVPLFAALGLAFVLAGLGFGVLAKQSA
jgi:LPXTG-motif cell wall-anchored protein